MLIQRRRPIVSSAYWFAIAQLSDPYCHFAWMSVGMCVVCVCKFPLMYMCQKIMKIRWQLTKLVQKLAGLLFWPTLYSAKAVLRCEMVSEAER